MTWKHVNGAKHKRPRVMGQDRGRNKVRINLYMPTDFLDELADKYETNHHQTFSRYLTHLLRKGYEVDREAEN